MRICTLICDKCETPMTDDEAFEVRLESEDEGYSFDLCPECAKRVRDFIYSNPRKEEQDGYNERTP